MSMEEIERRRRLYAIFYSRDKWMVRLLVLLVLIRLVVNKKGAGSQVGASPNVHKHVLGCETVRIRWIFR
jgi:hypothetical protein